jgi:hypothetical protein
MVLSVVVFALRWLAHSSLLGNNGYTMILTHALVLIPLCLYFFLLTAAILDIEL